MYRVSTERILERLVTCTGESDSEIVVPLPNSPNRLLPQLQTVPSCLVAYEQLPFVEMARTPDTAVKRTGIERPVFVPSPSCPYELSPQAQTAPSAPTAKLFDEVAAID